MSTTFNFLGQNYNHVLKPALERSVELAIIKPFMDAFDNKEILEVGNVTHKYFWPEQIHHDVLDWFEESEQVTWNDDARSWRHPDGKFYSLIVSISTVEHFGGKKDKFSPYAGIFNLASSVLSAKGVMILTWPNGWNEYLDPKYIPWTTVGYMYRESEESWAECDYRTFKEAKYGFPFRRANSLVIGTISGRLVGLNKNE